MQYPCNAFGLLSKKQYAPKAEIRFMIKLLTDLWRECTICASESSQIKEEHELEEHAASNSTKRLYDTAFGK